jgi:hypothetical protein
MLTLDDNSAAPRRQDPERGGGRQRQGTRGAGLTPLRDDQAAGRGARAFLRAHAQPDIWTCHEAVFLASYLPPIDPTPTCGDDKRAACRLVDELNEVWPASGAVGGKPLRWTAESPWRIDDAASAWRVHRTARAGKARPRDLTLMLRRPAPWPLPEEFPAVDAVRMGWQSWPVTCAILRLVVAIARAGRREPLDSLASTIRSPAGRSLETLNLNAWSHGAFLYERAHALHAWCTQPRLWAAADVDGAPRAMHVVPAPSGLLRRGAYGWGREASPPNALLKMIRTPKPLDPRFAPPAPGRSPLN